MTNGCAAVAHLIPRTVDDLRSMRWSRDSLTYVGARGRPTRADALGNALGRAASLCHQQSGLDPFQSQARAAISRRPLAVGHLGPAPRASCATKRRLSARRRRRSRSVLVVDSGFAVVWVVYAAAVVCNLRNSCLPRCIGYYDARSNRSNRSASRSRSGFSDLAVGNCRRRSPCISLIACCNVGPSKVSSTE